MKVLIPITIAILLMWMTIILTVSIRYPRISEYTEAKYLRNIDKFYPISNNMLCCNIQGGDSLTYIALVPYNEIVPTAKWYIAKGVGGINPKSELSKKIDSIIDKYENKLK